MPIDKKKLLNTLKEMKQEYISNTGAVRSSKFINKLHDYSEYELELRIKKSTKLELKPEAQIYGSHKAKKVDVTLLLKDNGPIVAISLKSQMSSIAKNFGDRYEALIGDATGLHEKFPFLVFGMLYLLPFNTNLGPAIDETPPFEKIERNLITITNRKDFDDRSSKYEHFALLVVDFEKDPPQIVSEYPKNKDLKIDNFFDNLIDTFEKRTPELDIRK